MPQLTFKWPAQTSYATEDFIISPSNEAAVKFLDTWPEGNAYAALLSGPASSGKTHLVQRWARKVRASVIDGAALGTASSAHLWNNARYGVLEDVHGITDETALFHLLRHAETQGLFLLLSSRAPASQLPFALPDLRSRLLALPCIHLAPPDEVLLRGFLMKCFADRQLRVGEDVTFYLTKRMERSFASASTLVDRIERSSIENKREITIPWVKPLVEKHVMQLPGTPPFSPKDAGVRLAQIHVLIADGDRPIAIIVRKVLESLGFREIRIARDGTQALQLLSSERIDMLITDWQMSPMDGISLVKHLRTHEDSPNRFIPIIMLTGNAEREHVEVARDVGVTEFVVKPFSAKTLCDRIALLIDNPRSFIMSKRFVGPNRRRRNASPPDGTEKRNTES